MKAKLIKVENTFYLKQGETILATSSIPNLSASIRYSLSKQNCDSLFGVVDVEMLAVLTTNEETTFVGNEKMAKGFIKGFNKAMELNKDKVFTLEDMMNCWNKALKFQEHKQTFGEYIQSLQQPTEIEVEIEMECCGNYSPPCNINCEYGGKPKLDSSENLILKKI